MSKYQPYLLRSMALGYVYITSLFVQFSFFLFWIGFAHLEATVTCISRNLPPQWRASAHRHVFARIICITNKASGTLRRKFKKISFKSLQPANVSVTSVKQSYEMPVQNKTTSWGLFLSKSMSLSLMVKHYKVTSHHSEITPRSFTFASKELQLIISINQIKLLTP